MLCYLESIDADLKHLVRAADLHCGWHRISFSVGVSEARAAALFIALQSQIG